MNEQRNLTEEEKRIKREEKDIEQVERSLRACRTNEKYINLIDNILRSKKQHIQHYVGVCIGKMASMRNDLLLPDPLPHDLVPIDLREQWVSAAAITGSIGTFTLRMVRRWGYRDAMLRQLATIRNIGTRGFITLQEHGCLQYSAEVTMRKYYSEMLTPRQIARIDKVLDDVGYVIGNQ
jgi:hypothetical protein